MRRLVALAPWIFVLIWSSGFVVAKYAFSSGDPLYFLAIRLIAAALILFAIALAMRAPIKISRSDFLSSLLIGVCLHALYLAGVWYAIGLGAPAGLSSVITSMQPVLVSLIAVQLLSEPLSRKQQVGLVLGFFGVVFVILPKMSDTSGFSFTSLLLLTLALLGSTVGTLLQKKIGRAIPILIGTTYQFAISGVVLLLVSVLMGATDFHLTRSGFFAMVWAVGVTSIAALLLFFWLLNRGTAAKVSSLFYLVPPIAVLETYILFGEKINAQGFIGIAMTTLGVALVLQD
jgi:drug/metabolite transporter (DMT)-like permease